MKNTTYHPYGCSFLAEIYRNHFRAWKFDFECSYRNNRSWFVHECNLYFDGSYYSNWFSKAQYYNRTWERWCYESVIKDAFIDFCLSKWWDFIEENKNDIKKICKDLEINYYFKFLKG